MKALDIQHVRAAFVAVVVPVVAWFAGCTDTEAFESATGTTQACEPAATAECTCGDGRAGSQLCKPDGTGYSPCYCGSETTSTGGTGAGPGAGGSGGGGSGGLGSGGVVGFAPEVDVSHPSDGETRQINTDIPFIGTAADVEDGTLPNPQWSSDLDGPLGTAATLTAQLSTVGTHIITLSATDSDGNTSSDSISLILQP